VIELEGLYRKLEHATFSQREQLAEEVARATPHDELAPIVRGLGHPLPNIRLGVIEVLRRAGYREAMRKLLEHAHHHDGDDRVFALRALAQLAEPGDDFLAAAVAAWLRSPDPFVAAHASRLASILELPAVGVTPPRAQVEPKLERLAVDLFAATTARDRIALVDAIERRGPQAVFGVAKLVLQKGNEGLVALLCRAVIRHAVALPTPEKLTPLLEAARRRFGESPVARDAIDDAVLALGGVAPLMARLVELDAHQLDDLVARLCAAPAADVALHAPALIDAIGRAPALWSSLGPALAHVAAEVRESARAELRAHAQRVIDELRKDRPLSPVTIVAATWVLARTCDPGEPLSRHLKHALDRLATVEAARALCALCARLATEEAAAALLAMLRDPLPEARGCARAAIEAWRSPWIDLAGDAISARYADEQDRPLMRRGDRLVSVADDEYALDGRGRPVRVRDTEHGGCLCCSPKHLLVRRRGEGLRCPSTWESHLQEDGRTTLERDHAIGRCKRCDSVRPRMRDGWRAICVDCGAGMVGRAADDDGDGAEQEPAVPSEHGRTPRVDALPKPPAANELEHVAPAIRAAMTANVFLDARDGAQRWSGSGIIIARDGDHLAILTNRHVIESDDGRPCTVRAMVVSGETVRTTIVWRARRGVDLAVIEARLDRPEATGAMAIGPCRALVGAEVFAIGNPMGLAWSYSKGTLSAIRHWSTQDGQAVRVLQTDTNIAPGSSGGGLFHQDGHLLGVVTFGRTAHTGASAHFALSVDAVRDALAREAVRWRGRALA
jgi:hypothetical protein